MVKIRLVSYLKTMAGFKCTILNITGKRKLRDLISFDLPEDRLIVIINDLIGGNMDSLISNEDYVLISPLFGGG